MRKNEVDRTVKTLLDEGWVGKSYKDFENRLGGLYSHDQIERIRARYRYIMEIKEFHEKGEKK